jgi:hypothetical protein
MTPRSLSQNPRNARAALHPTDKLRTKNEVIRRLTHIQRLAQQENYAEIQRLLHEHYV